MRRLLTFLFDVLTLVQCPRRCFQIRFAVPTRRYVESSRPRHRPVRQRLPHLATLRGQHGPVARALCARDQHAQGADFRPKCRSTGAFGGVADRDAAYGVVYDGVDVGYIESEVSGGAEERDAVGGIFDTQGGLGWALLCAC